ncbi:MAG: M56 family metallopeptidase [Eubacterium sp.]|nr:M56 family metallopeptidase [Eubacterium sp.]
MTKFALFLLVYSLSKILRVMAVATVLMAAALAVGKAGGWRTWRLNLGMLLLVPCSCLFSYSRIFFTGKGYLFTNWIHGIVTQEMAVCYFSVMACLAVRHWYVHRRLRRRILKMPQMNMQEYPACFCQGMRPGSRTRIRVYVTEDRCSPFAGGIRKPYIVMPRILLNSLSKEEAEAVLYHEMLHIRRGHLLLLTVYAWLKIVWWIHPMIYILDGKLRENMDYSSDEGSVLLGPLNAQQYAAVLLKTIQAGRQPAFSPKGKRRKEKIQGMAFAGSYSCLCFALLKKRIERLGTLRKDSSGFLAYDRKRRLSALLSAAVVAVFVAVAAATNLPRYTRMEEISAFDEKLHPLTYDLEREGFRAKVIDGRFSISGQEMRRFAKKHKLHGDYVVFSYDTILKVPGVGGLGQAAKVRLSDVSDVTLLGRKEWIDRLQEFVLKYLV